MLKAETVRARRRSVVVDVAQQRTSVIWPTKPLTLTSTICFVPRSRSSSSRMTRAVRDRRVASVRRTGRDVITATRSSRRVTQTMTWHSRVVGDRRSTRCSARSSRRLTTRPVVERRRALIQQRAVPRCPLTPSENRSASESV